ncbi:unnamed protein product [Calicophoron daubneyi]|uniref:Tetraspanin n=1 Tax=Calicophoron daubneyi TaxID=300641 RepID=A0AAV2SXW9_CALDB
MIMNIPCRIVLFAINMVALIVGCACIALGSLLIWGRSFIGVLTSYWFMPLIQKIAPVGSVIDILGLADRLLKTSAPGGLAVFAVGLAVAAIAILGFVGACCNMKIALQVYEALLGVIAMGIIAVIIVFYAKPSWVTNEVMKLFEDCVHHYKGMNSTDVNSLVVGLLMPILKCCGLNETDHGFHNFSGTDSFGEITLTGLDFPLVCCKMDESYELIATCPRNPTSNNSYLDTPCEKPLAEKFHWAMNYIMIGLGAAVGVMVVLIIFTGVTMCVDFV